MAGGAQSLNWSWRKIHSAANDDRGQMAADWLLLTADEERLPLPELPGSYAAIAPQPRTRLPRIVTISDAIPETGESVSKADSSQVGTSHSPTRSETEQAATGKSDHPLEAAVEPIQWTDQYSPVLEILK